MSITAERIPPNPSATITSLRAVGYKIEAAVADLIDNSITANAKNIWITAEWNNGDPWISFLDDGDGMIEAALISAMVVGSSDPMLRREPADLGRFGLGLKTASFSQAMVLNVFSLTIGNTLVDRCWNLDHVRDTREWELLRDVICPDQGLINNLNSNGHGTLVVWQKLDRYEAAGSLEDGTETHFYRALDEIKVELGILFHRYISGRTVNDRRIKIYMNGTDENSAVKAWDPFLRIRFDQVTEKQPLDPLDPNSAQIFGIILPHKDQIRDESTFQELSRPGDLTRLQGFYVYRADRLLCYGDWLNLAGPDGKKFRREEVYRLARVGIEIQNFDDDTWKIDIKKSMATPPSRMRKAIESYAHMVREKAKKVYWHRANVGTKPTHDSIAAEVPVWKDFGRFNQLRYEINRSHDLIESFISDCHILGPRLEKLFKLIERAVPIEKIYVQSTSPDFSSLPDSEIEMDDATSSDFRALYDRYLNIVIKTEKDIVRAQLKAIEKIRKQEPFNRYRDEDLLRYIKG